MSHLHKADTPSTDKPTRSLSIRAWLMLLALLIVALLAIDRIRLLETSRAERMHLARADVVQLARRAAEAQSEVIEATRAVEKTVARFYATTVRPGQDCRAFLDPFLADVPWIQSLSVVGPGGRIACSTEPSEVGTDMSNRPFVEKAQQAWDFVISNYVRESDGERPALVAAFPARARDKAGSNLAVILAVIDLKWIDRLSGVVLRRPGAAAVLLDGQGDVIASVPDRNHLVGRNFSDHPLVRDVLQRPEGTVTDVGLDGVRRITAFTRLPNIDAYVIVGLDEAAVTSRINREIGLAYVQLVMMIVVILLAAWFGGERLIIEPTRALARLATQIGSGDLEARPTERSWPAELVPLATALSDMASKLAEREYGLRSANHHLKTLASIDSLTRLPNRRSFDAGLKEEWQRAYEQGWPISLMMIDVDHFKLFNDHYGHLEGDRCLRMIGEALNAIIPTKADFAARYGGEEFALLLPATAQRAALNAAERLRAAVEELKIVHEKAARGYITISIGVASMMPGDKNAPQDLIEAADAGLYEAKRSGRNTVGVQSLQSPPLVPDAAVTAPAAAKAAPTQSPAT